MALLKISSVHDVINCQCCWIASVHTHTHPFPPSPLLPLYACNHRIYIAFMQIYKQKLILFVMSCCSPTHTHIHTNTHTHVILKIDLHIKFATFCRVATSVLVFTPVWQPTEIDICQRSLIISRKSFGFFSHFLSNLHKPNKYQQIKCKIRT